jgi:hypothetical protein
MVLSDVYSRPNRGMGAAFILGFVGWGLGAAGTIQHLRKRHRPAHTRVILAVIAWIIGASIAVIAGLTWLETFSPGFIGPILSAALGGVIGGSMTVPRSSVRGSLNGALRWGTSFLLFQFVAFYAGYFLMQMTVDPLIPILGHVWAKAFGWVLPAAVCGFLAARLISWRFDSA